MVSAVTASQALARLDPEDRRSVEQFRDAVRATFGSRIRDVRLFGSKVRGDDHAESDIDVLVLVADLDPGIHVRIHELASSTRPRVLPTVLDHDAYHRPISRATGFYQEMREESVRL